VEDDPQLRELYRSALRAAGYPVIAVEDGEDALRQIELTTPAAIVLDLGLPRLAGRDVHQELKAHSDTQDIPIIVVTGTDTSDLDAKAFACVLRKPVTIDELISAVEKCIRRAGGAPMALS
jgi:DNA-binding response OmpR family regulator